MPVFVMLAPFSLTHPLVLLGLEMLEIFPMMPYWNAFKPHKLHSEGPSFPKGIIPSMVDYLYGETSIFLIRYFNSDIEVSKLNGDYIFVKARIVDEQCKVIVVLPSSELEFIKSRSWYEVTT
ncbi:hypothetical protein BDF20DRAFT_833159 [Mycotypha africana]|uniref:uncharacterized protein n=1 Tax=Mycotypha africana TaxID=64632 RepID=UPI0023018BFF|nr:uncharacterized protein BDF20DRAFT_833159 [Mycotypha africana]KAI8988294.1 hypothetical protein BDF20DRAFT_833159 [Mycotypha africana]